VNDINSKEYLSGHDNMITTLAVSRNGTILCSGQSGSPTDPSQCASICVWDLIHRKLLRVSKGLAGSVISLDISPDSRFMIGIGLNDLFLIWEIESGETVFSKRIIVSDTCTCKFTPSLGDEYTFCIITDSSVTVNHLHFDLTAMSFKVRDSNSVSLGCINNRRRWNPSGLCFMSDGTLLIPSGSGEVYVYSITQLGGKFVGAINLEGGGVVGIARVGHDSRILAACADNRLRYLDRIQGSQNPQFIVSDPQLPPIGHGPIRDIYGSDFDDCFLLKFFDGNIFFYSQSPSSDPLVSFTQQSIESVNLMPTQNTVILNTGSHVEFFDSSHQRRIHDIKFSDLKFGKCTCISSSSRGLVVCGFESGAVTGYQWDVTSHHLSFVIPLAHRGSVGCIECGKFFFVTGGSQDSTVRVWRFDGSPNAIQQFTNSVGGILCIAIDSMDAHAEPATENIVYANDKREIFVTRGDKLLVKFFSASAGISGDVSGLGVSRIHTEGAAAEYIDPVVVTSHACGKICVWDYDYPNPIRVIDIGSRLYSMHITMDGICVVGGESGMVWICYIGDGTLRKCMRAVCEYSPIISVAQLALSEKMIYCVNKLGMLTIF